LDLNPLDHYRVCFPSPISTSPVDILAMDGSNFEARDRISP